MEQSAFSLILRFCALSLGAGYPFRLLAGLSGGAVLKIIAELVGATQDDNKILFEIATIPIWYFMIGGVFVTVMTILFQSRRLPEKPREIFDIIDEAEARGGISVVQRRQAYSNVVSRVIAEFAKEGTLTQARVLAKDALEDTLGMERGDLIIGDLASSRRPGIGAHRRR